MVSKSKTTVKNTLLVAQEISLIKFLCSNEQSVRHRGLQKLRRWLTSRSQGAVDLEEDDFNRLWKGLFYCLWMADKPLYQEEVVEMITQLLNCFVDFSTAVKFIKSFFNIISQEWFGIDHLRMDKCMMLVRRFTRRNFQLLKSYDWNIDLAKVLSDCYQKCLSFIPDGLTYHFADIYINELAKVGEGQPSSAVVVELIRPFAEHLSKLNHGPLINHIASVIFLNLIRQSDEGLDHQARFKAWRDRGFVGGTIDVIKKVDTDVDDEGSDGSEEKAGDNLQNGSSENCVLDPRAGHVDVELPHLSFDCQQMTDLLNSLRLNKLTTTKARKQIACLIKKFVSLSAGKYPLGLQKVDIPDKINWKTVIRNTAKELLKYEENEFAETCQNSSTDSIETSAINAKCGKWQVTPVKKNTDKKESSRCSLYSSKRIIKWEVIEKQNSSFINCNNLKNNTNKLKRKVHDNDVVSSAVKKVRLESNDGIDSEETSDTEIIIKRPVSIRGRKRRKKKKDFRFGYTNTTVTEDSNSLKDGAQSSESTQGNNSEAAAFPSTNTTPLGTITTPTTIFPSCNGTSSSKKKVAFVLFKNTVQEEREYQQMIREQPYVKFDGNKQPEHPIFKDKGIRSPINPFYKRFVYKSSS